MWRTAMALCFLTLLGCDKAPPAYSVQSTPTQDSSDPTPVHTHERGKMLIADAGPYHALLTAHLSKNGNELDVFFETSDKSAKPVAIAVQGFSATIQVRIGEGELKKVEFRPAPAGERPAGEAPERCSHFVASVPWLAPDVPLRVTIELPLNGRAETIRWNDFLANKYAHHQD